jgi:hypothetical protein
MRCSGAARGKVLTISDLVAGRRPGPDSHGHPRYGAATAGRGHPNIPRTTGEDGGRFEEVSLGCPHERDRHDRRGDPPREILPAGTTS